MEPITESTYVNLLIVEADGEQYVVETPRYASSIGELVSFDCKLGKCVNEMFVEKGEDKYKFVAALNPIYQAEKIFSLSWEAETDEEA